MAELTILVAGATGRLGRLVVTQLLGRGQHVRALTRTPSRAADLAAMGAEVVAGDVRDPRSLEPAVAGVDVVISAVQGFVGTGGVTPANVDRDGNANLIAAARSAGADVVLMSVIGASPEHPMELFRMKAAAEQALRNSNVAGTTVRASAFLELWQEVVQNGPGGRPLVFGRGDNPINFVAVDQVAAVVVDVATDPGSRGRTVEVSGPDNLTLNQLAARVHPNGAPRHVPRIVLHGLAHVAPGTLRRQAAAALVMDTHPMAHHAPGATTS